jgi:atrial natriuretic peptide receptor A
LLVKLNKDKSISNSFSFFLDMVVSGVPKKNGNEHAYQIATMALELIRQATNNCLIPYSNNEKLRIRVGLHSGPVCAGVVGSKMPR